MDTTEYIEKSISNTLEVFKKVTWGGITYLFQDEVTYKKFLKFEIYKWSDRIPDCVIDKFNEEEFKIYCTSETIYTNGSIADGTFIYAVDDTGKKANSLLVEIDDNPSVFYHEFGHFIDLTVSSGNCFSDDIKFKAIILKEATHFASAFVINYEKNGILRENVKEFKLIGYAQAVYYFESEEYFAEAFSIYMSNPFLLRRLCPETYEYINKVYCSFFERV